MNYAASTASVTYLDLRSPARRQTYLGLIIMHVFRIILALNLYAAHVNYIIYTCHVAHQCRCHASVGPACQSTNHLLWVLTPPSPTFLLSA